MNLAIILKALPWEKIIGGALAVVSMVPNTRKQPAAEPSAVSGDLASQVEELRQRVSAIESVQRSQAEVFAKMAEQGEKVAQVVHVLSARVIVLAWVAGAALLLSLVVAGRELLT